MNEPISLDVDYQGNLYYTQTGDYFPVHKISPNLSGDFAIYTSGFQPEVDDIMNSEFSDSKQRAAVCNSQFEQRKKQKGTASWDDVRKGDVLGLL